MNGPYETQRQAAGAVRHIIDSPPGSGAWRDGSLRLLEDACRVAGVQLGSYDEGVLVWLSGWEPWVVASIAGLITRAAKGTPAGRLAHLADSIEARLDNENADRQTIAEDAARELRALADGSAADVALAAGDLGPVLAALDEAADELRDRAANCPDCEAHPAELCTTCESRLSRVGEYAALRARLSGGSNR